MKHLHLYTSFSLPTCHDEQGNKINEPTNKNSFPPVYSSWSLLKIYFCPVNLMAITSLNTVRVIFLDAKQPGWNRLVSPSEGISLSDQFFTCQPSPATGEERIKTLLAAQLADVQCFAFTFYSGQKTLDYLHTFCTFQNLRCLIGEIKNYRSSPLAACNLWNNSSL